MGSHVGKSNLAARHLKYLIRDISWDSVDSDQHNDLSSKVLHLERVIFQEQ